MHLCYENTKFAGMPVRFEQLMIEVHSISKSVKTLKFSSYDSYHHMSLY